MPSKTPLLLKLPIRVAVARSLRGSEASALINFLDRVSELYASCPSDLKYHPQALVELHLDDKHWQLCLRLLSKMCRAQEIIPTSYLLRQDSTRVGSVQRRGGFSKVSYGEYLGYPVAIKDLEPSEGNFNKIFKVCLIDPAHFRRLTSD